MIALTSDSMNALLVQVTALAKRARNKQTASALKLIQRDLSQLQADVSKLEAELVRLRNKNRKLTRQKRQWMAWVGLAAKVVPMPDDTEYQE